MFEATTQVTLFYVILSIFVCITSFFLLYRPQLQYTILKSFFGIIVLLFCILFIGYREWWVADIFMDSARYGNFYLDYLAGKTLDAESARDIGFEALSLICSNFRLSVDIYFLICAFLYVYPLYKVSQKLSRDYWLLFFMMFITAMSFYGYGVNGIRNGIATSFMMLAFSNYDNKCKLIIWGILGVLFHKSVLLPFVAFIATIYYSNTKFYFTIWILAIPASFIINNIFSDLLLGISFIADRAEGYLNETASASDFSHTGFRYDFLIYGTMPIVIGIYFLYKKCFKNIFYEKLISCYMLTNAFWILINQVPYSNRFAYLSWFMMPVLLIYPFVFLEYINYRRTKMALILFLHIAFTLII